MDTLSGNWSIVHLSSSWSCTFPWLLWSPLCTADVVLECESHLNGPLACTFLRISGVAHCVKELFAFVFLRTVLPVFFLLSFTSSHILDTNPLCWKTFPVSVTCRTNVLITLSDETFLMQYGLSFVLYQQEPPNETFLALRSQVGASVFSQEFYVALFRLYTEASEPSPIHLQLISWRTLVFEVSFKKINIA